MTHAVIWSIILVVLVWVWARREKKGYFAEFPVKELFYSFIALIAGLACSLVYELFKH